MGESPPRAFCIGPVSSEGIKNHVYKVAQLPPVFGASIIKVLIKTTQNTTLDFYIFSVISVLGVAEVLVYPFSLLPCIFCRY